MSAEEYLSSTPADINWKVEAYNTTREEQNRQTYILGRLSSLAFAKEFPTFEQTFPKIDPDTGKQKPDAKTAKAIATAKALGHF
jgi:hypothetical protein